MKITKEQKEMDKYYKNFKETQAKYNSAVKAQHDMEVKQAEEIAREMIKNATSREDLRQKLSQWMGGYVPSYMDDILYKRFPMTKLEKALK